jgi:hypothetical protein
MGLRLAPEAKHWRKLWSVQVSLAGAGLTGVGSILGAFGGLPWVVSHPFAFAGITSLVFMAAAGLRMLDQGDGIPPA